ncbi:hypothetical protein ACFU96_44135 [Streptomyces sp. NPDC057620]|uniref:hypothetical protein n=1 Tax=Streptomyces sp. NPDC057620 TaxID=3346185 RepID=UPI003676A2FA
MVSPGLITDAERKELLAEATFHRARARRTVRPDWRVVDGRQFLGPARFWYSLDGVRREALHERLEPRVRALTARPMRPVQSNYLYYEQGDFLGLHHDQARCPYTVIALLDGPAEPLCLHSEVVGVPAEQLSGLVEPGGHTGGTELSLSDGALVFAGGVLPHHRMPRRTADRITIVTFCFTDEPV